MAKQDIDELTGTTTTGHEWDGIKELNTPLPRWWLWVFYATVVWSIGYWILYPAWPMVSEGTRGLLGWSSRAQVAQQLEDLKALRAGRATALEQATLEQIRNDPAMLAFARAQGRAAFGDNCAPCHGLGAQGSRGFPNLNDDNWIWGGTLDDIHHTIAHGIRTGAGEARESQMPAFGRDRLLERDQIVTLANHVRSLSGLPTRPGFDRTRGEELFAANCATCHGDQGRGNAELGAPNLTANIWLYGGDEAALVETISNSRAGVMPGWTGRLDATTVKSLAVYVHTLGGGR